MQKVLVILGIVLLAAGLLWPWLLKFPLGRLPGDIMIDRPNFKFYFPFTTGIIISIVVSVILWLIKK